MDMSDKEKALDALQKVLHISGSLMSSHVNNEIIKQSEPIRRALNKLPTSYTNEDRVSCFYSGMPGHSIPLEEAREQYSPGDSGCQGCGGRCQ